MTKKLPENSKNNNRKNTASSTSYSSNTYYRSRVLANKIHVDKNNTNPPSDISDNDEVEFVDAYETTHKLHPRRKLNMTITLLNLLLQNYI